MIRYIRTLQEALTEPLAAEWATMPAHKGERPLRPAHVAWLTGKIETGLFHPPRWAKAWLNGKMYRVNGQHSSTALAQANGAFPKSLVVLIDEFSCDSDDDVADLFAQFDAKGSVRSESEIVMATARQHAQLDDVRPTTIRSAVYGLVGSITKMGDNPMRINPEQKRSLVGDNIDFIIWSKDFTGTNRLRHSGVLAAMADTYRASPTKASEFWALVLNEGHSSVEHPTRKLGRFLSLHAAGKEFNRNKGKLWTPRAIYAKCIHAWNAFRTNVTTDMSYYEDSPLPEVR